MLGILVVTLHIWFLSIFMTAFCKEGVIVHLLQMGKLRPREVTFSRLDKRVRT